MTYGSSIRPILFWMVSFCATSVSLTPVLNGGVGSRCSAPPDLNRKQQHQQWRDGRIRDRLFKGATATGVSPTISAIANFGFARRGGCVTRRSSVGREDDFESLVEAATHCSRGYALGGDFAGLAATFNPGDGSLIPIPEHLVPPSLIEWGQEPKCLEVLVSEEFWPSDCGDDGEEVLRRITTKVLPDTGCSIDNLETIKVEDEIDLSSRWDSNAETDDDDDATSNVVGLQYSVGDDEIRLETIFELDGGGGYRMRVAVDLKIPSHDTVAIQTPMVLTFERRTSSVSSGGTISDGGGLDGRTVSMLLGERLRSSKTFADELPTSENYEVNAIKHVNFPGNISIAYGWLTEDDWVLQVGHVQNGMRRVVSRQFTVKENGELDFDVQSWVEEPQEVPVL